MTATLPFRHGDHVVAYTRYSGGEEQGLKDRSTKEQKDAIQKLCEENQLILDNVYEDAAISGTSTAGRDGFHLMISELRKPDARRSIAGVIVWSLSRFSRNFDDSQFFKAELRRLGYQIFSMSDKIEDSLDGRLLESINDYLNEKYARQVSFDVKRALRSDFLNFGVIPGFPPYGFRRVPVDMPPKRDGSKRIRYRWEPDPLQVPFVVSAFQMRADGASYAEIHRKIKYYKSPVSVMDMMRKPIYYGSMTYGGETIESYCEPIITKELWDRVQAIQDRPVKKGKRKMTNTRLLTDFLICADCGNPYRVNEYNNRGKRYAAYRCYHCDAPQIKAETVENAILDEICNFILTERNFQAMIDETDRKRLKSASPKQASDKDLKTKQIEVIDSKISKLAETISRVGYSEPLIDKLKELEQSKQEITKSIETRTPDAVVDHFVEIGRALKAIIASGETTLDEKRKAISFVVDRIEMKKDRTAVIYYRLPKHSIINENTSDIADVPSKTGAKQDFTQAPPREFESLFWP